MHSALILIDVQNDYFPGGNNELTGMEEAAQKARQLLNKFRHENLPIFHIQHISKRSNATFFLENSKGVEIHDFVKPHAGEVVITKHYPNSFRDTPLHEMLQQQEIQELIICGAMSHMCIDTSTRAAFDLGYKCVVVSDACATKSLSFQNEIVSAKQVHAAFMASLHGIFADVVEFANIKLGEKRQ